MSTDDKAQFGMIGMAVMGKNLSLNILDHGFTLAGYNRELDMLEDAVAASDGRIRPTRTLAELVAALERPRRILMMIKAGAPVDSVIGALVPLLDKGDIVIDGGNSWYEDTRRRQSQLAEQGVHFFGVGVSGGEDGARHGPSLMPGGDAGAYAQIQPVLEAIAANTDSGPCVTYVGPDGAGHFVKMVHNGIEYADMQLISEAYFLLDRLLGMKPDAIAAVFHDWNRGVLDSYLIEITAELLAQKDPLQPRRFLIDAILDTAGQKGTGKWTSASSLDLGVPAPTVAAAVFARFLSSLKEERVAASRQFRGPKIAYRGSKRALIEAVRDATYASKICAYAQGFALLAAAREEHGWKPNLKSIARIWRGGCIIRARFLHRIAAAYDKKRDLRNLLLDPTIRRSIGRAQTGWRSTVALAAKHGISCPAFMSALAYFDGYRTKRLPANVLQGQRDYFGSHTFERVDRPRGRFFHVDWADPERPIEER